MPLFTHRYGVQLDIPEPLNDLQLELHCFASQDRNNGEKLQPWQHFRNVTEMLWGEKSRKPFIWHPWAEKMLLEACDNQYLAVLGPASSGKCLAPDTLALMHDGSLKKAKEITVGDRIMGDDSTARRVLGTNSGKSPMYRIVQDRGGDWECNGDHILVLKRTWNNKKGWRRVGDIVEISVNDYIKKSTTFKRQHKLLRKEFTHPKSPHDFELIPFSIESLGEGKWNGFTLDGNGRFVLGNFTITHNSDFFAVWSLVNWLAAPISTKVMVTSTSLGESMKRIRS